MLADAEKFCSVIAHEICHHQHGYFDNSREFENDLSDMLGHCLYELILKDEKSYNNESVLR